MQIATIDQLIARLNDLRSTHGNVPVLQLDPWAAQEQCEVIGTHARCNPVVDTVAAHTAVDIDALNTNDWAEGSDGITRPIPFDNDAVVLVLR